MRYNKKKSVKRQIKWKVSRVLSAILKKVLRRLKPHGLSPEAMERLFSYPVLGELVPIMNGMTTGNDERFVRFWHEINFDDFSHPDGGEGQWCPYNKGGEARKWYGNCHWMLRWGDGGQDIKATEHASVYDDEFYKKKMVTWAAGCSLSAFSPRYVFEGYHFDKAGAAVFPSDVCRMRYLLGYLGSKVAPAILNTLKPNAPVQVDDIAELPWIAPDLDGFPAVRRCVTELVGLSKLDWDAYEHSWDFDSLPLIQAAYGKKKTRNGAWFPLNDESSWSLESKNSFFKRCLASCNFLDQSPPTSLIDAYDAVKTSSIKNATEMQQLEEENNRDFIRGYGLDDELTPEVLLKDVALTSNPYHRYGFDDRDMGGKEWAVMEAKVFNDIMKELISYAVGCIFGRYSIEMPGFILANQGEDYLDFYRKKLLSITDVLDEQARGDRLFQKLERMGKMGRLKLCQFGRGGAEIYDSGRGSRGRIDKPLIDFDMSDWLQKIGILDDPEVAKKLESDGLKEVKAEAEADVNDKIGGLYDNAIYSDASVELEDGHYSFYINCQRFKDPENGAPNPDCPGFERCNHWHRARHQSVCEDYQPISETISETMKEVIDEAMDRARIEDLDDELYADMDFVMGVAANETTDEDGEDGNEALNKALDEVMDEVMEKTVAKTLEQAVDKAVPSSSSYAKTTRYPILVPHCPMSELHFLPCRKNVMPIYASEDFGDDMTSSFKAFLKAAFGEEYAEENLEAVEDALSKKYLAGILSPNKTDEERQYIEAELKAGGRRNASIRNYFLESFYDDHLKTYHNLPIYWMFSSPNMSFNALIYMHRYQPNTVADVLDCLRKSQDRLSAQISSLGAFCSDPKIPHRDKDDALGALEKLSKQLAELRNYDRNILAPLAEKRIEIDLNDGIKVNYAKFGKALRWVDGLSE